MKNKIKNIKTNLKIKNNLSDEANSIIKTSVLVVAFFALSYVAIILLGKAGFFEKGYEKPTSEEVEISYNKAIMGTIFNRPEKTYYVAFDYFDNDQINVYFKLLVNNYSKDTALYKVDMSLGINSKYISDKGNPNANNFEDLAIKVPTLIKIKNGKIVSYTEDMDVMKTELSD